MALEVFKRVGESYCHTVIYPPPIFGWVNKKIMVQKVQYTIESMERLVQGIYTLTHLGKPLEKKRLT